MKKYALVEIEVDEDIELKYPNFIFNYQSAKEFMDIEIGSLNKGITVADSVCYKNFNPIYDLSEDEQKQYITDNDVGYRYKLLKVFDSNPTCKE